MSSGYSASSWGTQPSSARAAAEFGRLAEHAHAAGIGPNAAGDAANQRGFAGAIGAEQPQAGALRDFQRDAGDGGQIAEALDDGVNVQRSHRGGSHVTIVRGHKSESSDL